MTALERVILNWSPESWDWCWMDCPSREGYRLAVGGYEICLCTDHAVFLESGSLGSSPAGYFGAPLPPESVAAEWPWRRIGEVAWLPAGAQAAAS